MHRLNLTLSDDTWSVLQAHAERHGKAAASFTRDLIEEALAARDAAERRRRWAAAYASDREDAAMLLAELEGPQWEVWPDDNA